MRQVYEASLLQVQGSVVDEQGTPLSDLAVRLGTQTTQTDVNGEFGFADVSRDNSFLEIEGGVIRSQVIPVHLQQSLDETLIVLPSVVAEAASANETRLLFGGDLSFARRFLDPQETALPTEVPPPDPQALIQSDDPLPGSRRALSFIQPIFEQADYPVINFESPALSNPVTPHPTKAFAYFSLPDSLQALSGIGVQYVSLGNNHVFDYLAAGLDETLEALDAAGINYSGAGVTPDAAFAPYRVDLAGAPFSFVSATSVSGSQHEFMYVASDTQGGAADLRDDTRVADSIGSEDANGRFVVAQLHTGKEYTFSPSAYAQGRMKLTVEAGADLVIAHHPHVAQGFGYHNGVLMYHGLGNFLFDQDRHDTMLGVMAQVDVAGSQIARARGIPIYLEDYRPRPITGALANRFLRRLAEFSFGEGVTVMPEQHQAWIMSDASSLSLDEQNMSVEVTVDDSGVGVVDLRHLAASAASLAAVSTTAPGVSVQPGRDLLLHGDFEDYDVDADRFETIRWDVNGTTRFPCQAWVYHGAQAMCLTRGSANTSDTVVAFRNRVRTMGDATDEPNKDLSLVGYVKGENAGAISIVARYYASIGSGEFGEELAFSSSGGTFDWQPFVTDLSMPADMPEFDADKRLNPRALRLFLRHAPMASGVGLAVVDELAIVSWEEVQDLSAGASFTTPHARDFLRIQASPGVYQVDLTFHAFRPSVAN